MIEVEQDSRVLVCFVFDDLLCGEAGVSGDRDVEATEGSFFESKVSARLLVDVEDYVVVVVSRFFDGDGDLGAFRASGYGDVYRIDCKLKLDDGRFYLLAFRYEDFELCVEVTVFFEGEQVFAFANVLNA